MGNSRRIIFRARDLGDYSNIHRFFFAVMIYRILDLLQLLDFAGRAYHINFGVKATIEVCIASPSREKKIDAALSK